jgi:cell division topological specificity factor
MFDFSNLFGKKTRTRDIAKERLKLVLINDRTGLSQRTLEELRVEIFKVISKYIEIDENSLDIQMTSTRSEDGRSQVPAIVANIPIKKVKGKATTRG